MASHLSSDNSSSSQLTIFILHIGPCKQITCKPKPFSSDTMFLTSQRWMKKRSALAKLIRMGSHACPQVKIARTIRRRKLLPTSGALERKSRRLFDTSGGLPTSNSGHSTSMTHMLFSTSSRLTSTSRWQESRGHQCFNFSSMNFTLLSACNLPDSTHCSRHVDIFFGLEPSSETGAACQFHKEQYQYFAFPILFCPIQPALQIILSEPQILLEKD